MVKRFLITMALLLVLNISAAKAAEFEMVEYSAHVKLQWLAASGLPEGRLYIKNLNKANHFNKDNLKDFDRIEKVNALFQEMTYASVINFIKSNGYSNVYDIASSYSPRVIDIVEGGGRYVVAELDAVAFVADGLAKKALDPKYYDKFIYGTALVEDEEAMMSIASNLDGKVCIIENGLLVYLTRERVEAMFKNVKKILAQKGGCMITTDLVMKPYFIDTAAALYGQDNAETLYNETKEMYEQVLEGKLIDDHFKSEKQAIAYLNSLGLKVDKVELLPSDYNLYSYKKLKNEQVAKVRELIGKKYLWVITVRS